MAYPLCLAVAAIAVCPALAAGAARGPDHCSAAPVKLVRYGDTWTLSNGIVEVVFDTARVGVTEFRFAGGENVLGADGMYLDCNVPEGYYGFTREDNPAMQRARVCARTREYVDVAVRGRFHDPRNGWTSPLALDWHIVLQRDDAGFYSYVDAAHVPGARATDLEQLRIVMRCAERFTDYALTPDRMGRWADHKWKYTLSRQWEPWSAHGLVDPLAHAGVWAAYGVKRWCRGPDQRDLTVHDGIILTMFEARHYGVFPTSRPSPVTITDGWRKVYGPVFYMITRGASTRTMYLQAGGRAEADQRQRPPRWLAADVDEGAAVTGEVAESDSRGPVRVVLRNDRYVFWATARPGRLFRIPNVLPGTYDLIAREGPYGLAHLASVTVEEGVDLGTLQLVPSMPPGKLLWQIGNFDDSCEEFAGGRHCWEFEGFRSYAQEFPEPRVYTVGASRADRDWYWIHPGPFDEFGGNTVHPRIIRFTLKAVPKRALLHIVLADTMSAAHIPPPVYRVELNGRKLASLELGPGGQAGTYCVAPVGVPQHYRIRIPAQSMVVGSNELTVYPERNGYVMYDYLALQEVGRSE